MSNINESVTEINGEYLRIKPGTDISINTPILNITIGYDLIKPVNIESCNYIYTVDIKKVRQILNKTYNHMFENPDHINDYIPVGQIDIRYRDSRAYDSSTDPNISIILANRRVVPQSKNYRKIKNNIWVAESNINNIKMRSIGTIYYNSTTMPKYSTPVFPISYLKQVSESEPNYDIYSDKAYGRYILNDTALNIDKKNLRMINSTGDIALIQSNTFVPMTPDELYGADASGLDERYNRKVYFTAQGSIANDQNCVRPRDNMMKMNQMECNGIATTIKSHKSIPDNDADFKMNDRSNESNKSEGIDNSDNNSDNIISFDDILSVQNMDGIKRKVLTDRKKQLILREKDEPWFTDPKIVGDVAVYDDPHTITGHHDTFEATDEELYDIIDELKPKGSIGTITGDSDTLVLIGTFDGDTEEINMPFVSDCAINPVIGYSRYDKMQKCLNQESQKNIKDLGKHIENFDSTEEYNSNNTIMWVMCFIILALMVYRIRRR